jgi:hypothetical protein
MNREKPANLMVKFIRDRQYLDSYKDYVAYSETGRPHLIIAHPAILATFMGYLKYQIKQQKTGREVFFRGQTRDHPHIIPSLLRGDDFKRINTLSAAYEELKIGARKMFNNRRFRMETLDNFFQHYGIKSKTLDLVDNLYIAVWFATNTWKQVEGFNNLCIHEPSSELYGWIYFMSVEPPKAGTKSTDPDFSGYCNLREYHSSLSARLHCQHGITYFKPNDGEWTADNRTFDDLCIAAVKFPNSQEFKMDGTIFTKEFLFPNSEIDNTYKLLREERFAKLLAGIEEKYGLSTGDLGRIWTYNF